MKNINQLDGHSVRVMYNERERVGVAICQPDMMLVGGFILFLYELFDGEGTLPSCRIYEQDLLQDYGPLGEYATLNPIVRPWLERMSTLEYQNNYLALLRATLIGCGLLSLIDADLMLLQKLELARKEFGADPLVWSDESIAVVIALALNEAVRSRQEMAGRRKLANELILQATPQ